MVTATIQSINRMGSSNLISVNVLFSDNIIKNYQFPPNTTKEDITAAIKIDIDNNNAVDTKIDDLQNLINMVIS